MSYIVYNVYATQGTNTRTLNCDRGCFLQSFSTQLLVTLFEARVGLTRAKASLCSLPFVALSLGLTLPILKLLLRWMRTYNKASSSKAISPIGEWQCDFIQFYHWLVVFVVVSTVDDGYGSKQKTHTQK